MNLALTMELFGCVPLESAHNVPVKYIKGSFLRMRVDLEKDVGDVLIDIRADGFLSPRMLIDEICQIKGLGLVKINKAVVLFAPSYPLFLCPASHIIEGY